MLFSKYDISIFFFFYFMTGKLDCVIRKMSLWEQAAHTARPRQGEPVQAASVGITTQNLPLKIINLLNARDSPRAL